MSSEHTHVTAPVPTTRAVRNHLALVLLLLALGATGGWWYAASAPATWSSTARVLVNPASGNPFAPSPSAVRQDEPTSLETEAVVARSAEVLDRVAAQVPDLTTNQIARGLQITVPPNTQVLEITFTASSASLAQRVANEVATIYLENRDRRSDAVTAGRVKQVEDQTVSVLADLRAATAAAQQGTPADREFQAQLATALRNQLVNLRAQRTALETSDSPADAVISPASTPQRPTDLVAAVAPVGGALGGLLLALLLAVALERARGVVRSAAEVEELGVPVVARVPVSSRTGWLGQRGDAEQLEDTVRLLRTTLLGLEPKPGVVAVAPAGPGEPVGQVAEALAGSFARAGHAAVLVRTEEEPGADGLVVEEGLAQVLAYERLNVLELLRPSVEPLLCVLPAGQQTAASRELLTVERLRPLLAELVQAGNVVVIEASSLDRAEGRAVTEAAEIALVVVTAGRTSRTAVGDIVTTAPPAPTPVGAVVLTPGATARRTRLATDGAEDGPRHAGTTTSQQSTRAMR